MEAAGIYAQEAPYLDRYVQLGIASGKLINVTFPRTPDEHAEPVHDLLDRIQRYLEGAEDSFTDVEIALTVPTDHRAVLEALRNVPYGEQISVERLTAMTPDRDPESEPDRELTRTALAENPVPIIIPDHRVRDGPSAAPPDVEQKLRTLENL